MGRSSPFVSLEEDRRRASAAEGSDGEERAPVPFFILTGFLGAGKTTLLNRILAAPQGRRIAVLVNDVGQINVDRQLITAESGDLIELSGGCVCCKVDLQRDLFSGVDDLVERAKPDAVILETTGIADPRVLLAAFADVEARRKSVAPSGVICVVDAEVGLAGEARVEWSAQVGSADRIILSKVERTTPVELLALHARLAELAPQAERAAFPPTEEGTHALVRYMLEPRAAKRTHDAPPPSHRHTQLNVYAIADERAYLEAPLLALVASLGDALVRMKGFARIVGAEGKTRWRYLERAGKRIEASDRDPTSQQQRSELVFIVEQAAIDEETLQRRLWACRAP